VAVSGQKIYFYGLPNQRLSQEKTYDEKELIKKIVQGDRQAFEKVYRLFSATLFNAVMVYVKDVHLAGDILQIVFIKFWEKRERLGDIRSLEDFLFIMARNTALNHWKKAVLENKVLGQLRDRQRASDNSAAETVQGNEYRRIYTEALSKLSPQQYKVYLLAEEGDFSYEDIAQQMGLSRLTVKKHLELARKFVRGYMTRYFRDYFPVVFLLLHLSFLALRLRHTTVVFITRKPI
jgi:RNA polymerase sigma factor (sigma-70 family)